VVKKTVLGSTLGKVCLKGFLGLNLWEGLLKGCFCRFAQNGFPLVMARLGYDLLSECLFIEINPCEIVHSKSPSIPNYIPLMMTTESFLSEWLRNNFTFGMAFHSV
jgi:hypothetical protein